MILPTIILMMALVLLASALFANYMARHVTRPVRSSMAVIHRIEKGDFDARLEVTTDDEIGEMMEAINNMAGQLKELIQNVQDKQETLRVAQIENLKGQLKPHFLYNVFDLIRWKVYVSKPEEVDRIIVSLAKLLRASIDVGDGVYTIREEIGFLQNYAELNQALRPNLKIRFQISGELMEEKIPRLLLQPLVENAIKHGIGDRKEGGLVAVSGFWKEGSICLLVEDNGAGIEEEKLRQLKEEKGQKENIGIDNVRERVKLYGGPGSSMEISSTPGKGTLVRIVIRKGGEQEWKENG